MNKLKIFYLLITISTFFSCGKKISSEQKNKPKENNIKIDYYEVYNVPSHMKIKEYIGFNNNFIFEYSKKLKYNDEGNKIEESYSERFKKDKPNETVKKYEYDNNDNLIIEKEIKFGKLEYTTIYDRKANNHSLLNKEIILNNNNDTIVINKMIYDNKDNLIENKYFFNKDNVWEISKSHSSIFKYDKKNRKTLSQSFGKYGNKYSFEYDDNIIIENKIDKNNKPVTSWRRKYDEKGNLIEEKRLYQPGNRLSYLIKYIYNSNNDLIEEVGSGPHKDYILKYKYKYDKNGNWIEKVYYRNNNMEQFTKRKIEYKTLPNNGYK